MFLYSISGLCNENTVVYFALQYGTQDTGSPAPLVGKNDTYLSTLENIHGTLRENREVKPKVVSFDFYKTSGALASGFGLEVHSYNKSYSFENNSSSVDLSAVGLLYGFNFYYRGDTWFPFIGFGTGNYSVKVNEKLNLEDSTTYGTVFGQVDKPFFYKFGVRIPLNGIGLVLTQQYISADLDVATENKPLSLGGVATFIGLYYTF